MLILIDGYNVLKGVARGGEVSPRERDQFIAQLGAYAHRKKHMIIVVFDGGLYGWPDKEERRAVKIIFTGARETADDVIRQQLKKHRGKDLLLVSSDRELGRNASRLEIPSIDSEDFYLLMQAALEKTETAPEAAATGEAIKTTEESTPELDRLMQEASVIVPHKPEDRSRRDSSVGADTHGLGRIERKLLEKLKKL